jgi:LmbE family N-acetylglucosaminyl deacetylase
MSKAIVVSRIEVIMADSLKLLAILAHPDDESLGVGSTLAKYADEGVETYLICATKGERGWMGAEKDDPGETEMGRIREQELVCAAKVLGIREVHFLGYIDGELDRADPQEAADKISRLIRSIRPHVAVTFGPDGAYGHPDHIAISQFATAACLSAADASHLESQDLTPHRVSKFYYFINDREIKENYTRVFSDLGMDVDGVRRLMVAWDDWMYTTLIDGSAYWKTALRAVNCHESQVAAYGALKELSEARSISLWGKRTFYRVFSSVNGGRAQESDLFEGLRPGTRP